MRLSGSGNSDFEGRVEILYEGRWGTVCQNHFTIDAADVVCRQLGFEDATSFRTNSFYGAGSGVTWLQLKEPGCSGTEALLAWCPRKTFGTSTCNHENDVGVICSILEAFPCKYSKWHDVY